jgi:putative flippase GtrA
MPSGIGAPSGSALDHLLRLVRFAAVSGAGLLLDFALFLALLGTGVSAFAANAVGGGVAVAFVYFASVRRIFAYRGRFLLGLFGLYLAYQCAGVTLASLAVAGLSGVVPAALAKILILPVTFAANFAFMSWLTRRRRGAPAMAA